MATNLIEDGKIRIFISSTFRDMQAERDHLMQAVFPSLYSYCAERNILLQALDLRWGITEEQEKQGKVVELCLKAIKNTRPFFIGLLGERYGWVPDEKKREEIARKTSVFRDYPEVKAMLEEGMSITEIEIQQGVLRSKEDVHAYFYLRAPYIDPGNNDSMETDNTKIQRLEDLKKTLQTYPVRKYESPKDLGELVEKDFRELINSLCPDEELKLSAVEKDRLQQRFFLKSKTAVYVPGPELEALDQFAEGGEQCLVITGEGGIGKSALLAQWIQNREGRNDEKILYNFIGQSNSLADFHFVGQSQYPESFDIIAKWLTYELMDAYGLDFMPIGLEGPKPYNDKTELQYQLNSIKDKGGISIVLDGIDKLSNKNEKMLAWLPELPPNVKLIVSMRKSRLETDFFAGINCGFLPVAVLDIKRRKELIKNYLEYFGKALDDDQTEKIAAHEMNANPLALCTLLDELRVFGVFEELNNEIDRYLRAPDIAALFTLVLERLEKAFNYDKNNNYVKDVLSLIYVSEKGLSQLDIQKSTFSSSENWSRLFSGMAGHLVILHGCVNFSHDFIRDAVKRQYLPKKKDEREYAERLELFRTNARAYYDKYGWTMPMEASEYYNRGLFSFNNGGYADAIKDWTRAIELNPNYVLAYNKRAWAYDKTGKADKAIDDWEAVLRLNPAHDTATKSLKGAYLICGIARYNKEDYDGAIADFSRAIELDPDDIGAYNSRGNARLAKEDYNGVIADFTQIIRLDQHSAITYYNRGCVYSNIGDYDHAIADWEEALKLDPDDADIKANLEKAKAARNNKQ